MHLLLIILAAVAVWAVRAYFWPFRPCPRCEGRKRPGGTRWGSTGRRFGPCGRCDGTRKVQVRGSRTVHRAVRSAIGYRRNRKEK